MRHRVAKMSRRQRQRPHIRPGKVCGIVAGHFGQFKFPDLETKSATLESRGKGRQRQNASEGDWTMLMSVTFSTRPITLTTLVTASYWELLASSQMKLPITPASFSSQVADWRGKKKNTTKKMLLPKRPSVSFGLLNTTDSSDLYPTFLAPLSMRYNL